MHNIQEIVISALLINYIASLPSDKTYNETVLYEKYPGYGSTWMFLPDDEGIAHVAIMEFPKNQVRLGSNVEESVRFILYTRENDRGELLKMENDILKKSNYSIERETKLITHGWMSDGSKSLCTQIKNAYLKNYDYNVIIVDWGAIAGNLIYPLPALDSQNVAIYVAKFIDFLICSGTNPKNIHLIGHSLGAHVFGVAGSKLTDTPIGRVTGLDPASPLFNLGLLDRLSTKSAEFVDVIHTCAGAAGLNDAVGHVDFYPNGGGPPQPGCFGLIEIIQACSHASSWKYFMNTIEQPDLYLSKKCSSYNDYKRGVCKETAYMGNSVLKDVRGSYYVHT